MAIQEQVELLKKGTDVWNKWSMQYTDVAIDLIGANLSQADLSGADLSVANLSGADLTEAKLSGAKLMKADLSGAKLMKADLSEAYLIGANLSRANLSQADLGRTNLVEADLSEADLSRAYLSEVYLIGAKLIGAKLVGAYLREADLRFANLREASLSEAHLIRTNLSQADLSLVDLRFANLIGANLSEADLSEALTGQTQFDDIDLRRVKGLETIGHWGPSPISTSTIEKSKGDIPEVFLRGAGLSNPFIEYIHALVNKPIQYYTCFLSYSSRDQNIAERLYADLQGKGVRCWYAPHELKPGDYYREKIGESIRVYDKLVLILSSHSIKSEWVEKEVETALEREESMDMTRHVLFPIRLDDTAMTTSRKWVSTLRYLRHIGDFTGWKDHDAYQTAFQRLLHDLKAEPVKEE